MPEPNEASPPSPPLRKRWLPRLRFSLRTLVILVLLIGSAATLWWHWEPWTLAAVLGAHSAKVWSATISPDEKLIAGACNDNTASIWDAETFAPVALLKAHTDSLWFTVFSPDGKLLITTSQDCTARLWRVGDFRMIATLSHPHPISCARFSPNGSLVAIGGDNGEARIWDTATGAVRFDLSNLLNHPGVNRIAYAPNGRQIAVSNDEIARVWRTDNGALQSELMSDSTAINGIINSVAFSSDSSRLVTAGNKTVRIWDVDSGRSLLVLQGHTSNVNSAIFSPEGERIATASADGTARVWDARSGSLLSTLNNGAEVSELQFSSDGARLVTTSERDPIVRIWDANTGYQLSELRGYPEWAVSGRFFAHDTKLMAACGDGRVRLWHRRRPEYWWGIAWLPEFWLTVLFAGALVWSVWRDRRVRT